MRSLVLTGWCGTEFAKMAAHTLPVLEAYAKRHGHDFACANLFGERPASWMKITHLHKSLQTYDRVAWIDTDVVVMRDDADILAELPAGQWQAMVEHDTECGMVPNCGVWVLSPDMVPVLGEAWNAGHDIHHGWWEQASILRRMGYAVTDSPHASLDKPTTLYERTTFMAATWNHHPRDRRRVESPRFVHVTQYADRLGVVRELCGRAAPAPAAGA
jgi:hypothetical protein